MLGRIGPTDAARNGQKVAYHRLQVLLAMEIPKKDGQTCGLTRDAGLDSTNE
jgi:hypothetical protein